MSSQRVEAYAVTGTTERVYPVDGPASSFTEARFMGFTLANLSDATGYRVTFTDARSRILDTLYLEPGETRSDWYGPQGIIATQAVTATFVPDTATDVVVGSVRIG